MKIKNVRQYRSLYKATRPVSNELDEHFIGNYFDPGNGEFRRYGWFSMYHGDKDGYGTPIEGISNFLQSFLDMAKDGQAVYEFLQNAVDAGSTHFTMAWGKDEVDGHHYVLVANNGAMFNYDSIRSILNVGSSTKTADSQHIGKFGIGFKLAHRLVGKNNGLEELLSSKPTGPILFSWQNGEIEQLSKAEVIEPEEVEIENKGNNVDILDKNPWLFKILATCFPYLPENPIVPEDITDLFGQKANATLFKDEEYHALARWVSKYSDVLNPQDYKEGSLFFIKLGTGKEKDLADKNLAQGVKFSLAILQETAENKQKKYLERIQLNRNAPITRPDLNYLYFRIDKNQHLKNYLQIRFDVDDVEQLTPEQQNRLENEEDIEVLFGFKNYDNIGEYFEGAPNFYLYFPLSEEVHDFNFVLHSNAFYKASSRTFLHKAPAGEEDINERLLRSIAKRVKDELVQLQESTDPQTKTKFLHFYAALLTSRESLNQDRQWVREPFINELTATLRSCVPIKSDLADENFAIAPFEQVYLKKTAIEFDFALLHMDAIRWFYWDSRAIPAITEAAKNKLELYKREVSIFTLLDKKDVYVYINEWIEADFSRAKIIFKELNQFPGKESITEHVKQNLTKLRIFQFTDENIYSIEGITTIQDKGFIILHNQLAKIQTELKSCELQVSLVDLDEYDFYQHYNSYLSTSSQLRSQAKLIEIFSKNANVDKLNKGQKLKIFRVFRDMSSENRIERLRELRLFRNTQGSPVHLKNLLASTDRSWLKGFIIHPEEREKELERYLVSQDSELYAAVIYPFWTDIQRLLDGYSPDNSIDVIEDVIHLYNLTEYSKEGEKQLDNTEVIPVLGKAVIREKFFFHENLLELTTDEYHQIQNLLLNTLRIQIPDRYFLKHLGTPPFELQSIEFPADFGVLSLKLEEVKQILKIWQLCDLDLINQVMIAEEDDGSFSLISNASEKLFLSRNPGIQSYIRKYHGSELIMLPQALESFEEQVELRAGRLSTYLLGSSNMEDEKQKIDLIEALLEESPEILLQVFEKLRIVELDGDWENENTNALLIKYIQRLAETEEVMLGDVQDKIAISADSNIYHLSSIDEAADSLLIMFNESEVSISRSSLLGLQDNSGIKHIIDFAQECQNRELLPHKLACKIFKVKNSGISDELVTFFNEAVPDGNLLNSHQLAFVLICPKIERNKIKDFKVESEDGSWNILVGNWLLPNVNENQVFNPAYVLSERYSDLSQILQLESKETLYYGMEEDEGGEFDKDHAEMILPGFLFQTGCSIKVFNSDQDDLILLKHLHLCWQSTPNKLRTSRFENQPWTEILNFNPEEKVWSDLVLEDEKLPQEISNWLNEYQPKTDFLQAIGIATNNSYVAALRRWFLSGNNEDTSPEIIGIPLKLISNTLVGLAEGFEIDSGLFTFKKNSAKYNQIVLLIEKLLSSEDEFKIRIPVYLSSQMLILGNETEHLPVLIEEEILGLLLEQLDDGQINHFLKTIPVIQRNERYDSFVSEAYEELTPELVYIPDADSFEHDEPFYRTWRDNNRLKLFKQQSLRWDVYFEYNHEKIYAGAIHRGDFHLIENDAGDTVVYYRNSLQLEGLAIELEKVGYTEQSKLIEDLIEEQSRVLSSFYHAISSSGQNDFDEDVSKLLKESLAKQHIKDERKKLAEGIAGENKYSYTWFESYLKYLMSFEELAETTTQKTIAFQKIKEYEVDGKTSKKYFLLEAANSLIPVNIEAFKDFNLTLTLSSRRKENIQVEGVSKKGQNLLIYIPTGISSHLLSLFDQVVNIKISFTPTLNLIERLYRRFSDPSVVEPWEEMENHAPPIHFIYGPPGTGKTTQLCSLLESNYLKNPALKVLVLVPTNKAGDVIAKRLIQAKSNLSIIRIGNATDPELEALDEEVYKISLHEDDLDYANVIITTIHRLPYFQIMSDDGPGFQLYSSQLSWDKILFDESSMIGLPYAAFALMALMKHNERAQIVVAGDPKQIPPVVDVSDKDLENLDMEEESIYKMFNIDQFKKEEEQELRSIDTIQNLETQYRSIEAIGQLYSAYAYQDRLNHDRNLEALPVKPLPDNFIGALKEPITFINFPVSIDTSVLEPKKLLYSSYHAYAGILVAEIIKHFDNCNENIQQYSIGVISPYKAQAMLLSKLISSFGISKNLNIHCDTVHGFQGDECDIIVFLINPNNTHFTGHPKALLSKEYIYNVAISRAKDHLWILNPINQKDVNPHISNLRNIAALNKPLNSISSKKIERELFGEDEYIVNHSYLTGHDNINVFGQVEMKYFIKAGDSAIDIQLRLLKEG